MVEKSSVVVSLQPYSAVASLFTLLFYDDAVALMLAICHAHAHTAHAGTHNNWSSDGRYAIQRRYEP